jgi:N-acyl-phosphatidylethanolamine-hydrolysing phospholipase D
VFVDVGVVGIKSWFGQTGIPMDLVEEMDWWESTPFDLAGTSEGATGENRGGLRVTCVPAQHNSGTSLLCLRRIGVLMSFAGRGVNDQCSTLWCGWVLEVMRAHKDAEEEEERTGSIYFAGYELIPSHLTLNRR